MMGGYDSHQMMLSADLLCVCGGVRAYFYAWIFASLLVSCKTLKLTLVFYYLPTSVSASLFQNPKMTDNAAKSERKNPKPNNNCYSLGIVLDESHRE